MSEGMGNGEWVMGNGQLGRNNCLFGVAELDVKLKNQASQTLTLCDSVPLRETNSYS
ncbi:hypothetical protein NIES4075_26160 [Tolypothrix sp. NIES-4075]|nr:hypothetical protein NIES4075_26160 [Tolypothrix sp. NIES-4075]